MSIQTDTIAAVATPAGPGAIGILRLSGPRAADIAAAVFRPLGGKGLLDRPVRTLVYGDLLDREGVLLEDEEDLRPALEEAGKGGLSLVDAFLAQRARRQGAGLATLDRKLGRRAGVELLP